MQRSRVQDFRLGTCFNVGYWFQSWVLISKFGIGFKVTGFKGSGVQVSRLEGSRVHVSRLEGAGCRVRGTTQDCGWFRGSVLVSRLQGSMVQGYRGAGFKVRGCWW